MSCGQCNPDVCIAPKGWVCKESGDFYTTGEYSSTINFFNIHGVSLKSRLSNDNKQSIPTIAGGDDV